MSARAIAIPDALRACSACAGDYEDPERTARCEEDEDQAEDPHGDKRASVSVDEFPVNHQEL